MVHPHRRFEGKMKQQTGIILFIVGLLLGFGAGLIISTASRPAVTQRVSMSPGSPGSPPQVASPADFAASSEADQQAALKTRNLERIKQLKLALKNEPDNVEILVALGNLYFDVGQHLEAIEHYDTALKINPKQIGVLVDTGIMYRRTRQFEKALEMFDTALKIDDKFINAILNKAVVYKYDLGDYTNSLAMFKKFMDVAAPGHPAAESARLEVDFLENELKEGRTGPTEGSPESHEGHDHD